MQKNQGTRYTITLDDDPTVCRLIEKSTGIKSISYVNTESFLAEADQHHPVAIFVDIHLEMERCGLDLIPGLRARWPFCALIVITGDPTDEALSEALASGADDFIRKPIRKAEVAARLQSRLGDLAEKQAQNILRVGDITFHIARRSLKGKRGQVFLSPTAALLLTHLIQAKGTVLQRQSLKQKAWGNFAITDNALDRKIYEVRKALSDISEKVNLKTVYGVGFGIETQQKNSNETEREAELSEKKAS